MGAYILSIDIGSSSCKTVLMALDGTAVSRASREYPTHYDVNDVAQQDSEHWWNSVVETTREVLECSGIRASEIAAIAADAQSSVMLPLDREGRALYPAILCSDKRAKEQVRFIESAIGQETISRINGNRNDASNVAPKIMWFRDTYPELYEKTYQVVNATGFLVRRLTGIFSMNRSEGGLTQIFDIESGQWSEELVHGCGLDLDKLPPVYGCSEIVGTVQEEAAGILGVPTGIPVLAGCMDVCACALGCGIASTGDGFITGGTITALGSCSERPVKDEALHVYHHIVPGLWCNVAGVDFGGGSYRWFRDKMLSHLPKESVYPEMNRLAALAPAGAGGLLFLPSLTGQRCPQWNADMRGVFFGITPFHGQPEFLRAIMEGNAYGIRKILDLLEHNGAIVRQCVIAGGISASDLWMEIFATVLNKPLYRNHSREDTALGNMISAANAVGLLNSYDVALPCREMERCPDNPADRPMYEAMYRVYKIMEESLYRPFAELAGVQHQRRREQ